MTTSSPTIIVSALDAITTTATEAAISRRDELLATCSRGRSVPTAESATKATEVLREVTTFTRTIEAARRDAKAPVLALGKRIDAVAADLTAELTAELGRINSLVSEFNVTEQRRAAEERRKAAEEQDRIYREAEQKRLDEAEAARAVEAAAKAKQDELALKASRAKSEERRAVLEAQAAKAKAKAEADAVIEAKRIKAEKDREAQEMAATHVAVAMAQPVKAAGTALRMETKFEITDIYALFDAVPGMVILTPNKAAIKAQIKTLPEGASLPGVKHWQEAKTTIRS